MRRIAFVTHAGLPRLASDDLHTVAELRARGASVEPAVWDDADVDWLTYDAVVLRSCWDYHLRERQFGAWIDRLERDGARLWNPAPLVRWNARKHYLRELADTGVHTVPTRWVERGASTALADILEQEGWRDAVVKPLVSASAHETWRTGLPVPPVDAERFAALAERYALMVQPFVRSIVEDGEWSLCFFAGRYSHAVQKQPCSGDFRVQLEHGGRVRAATPSRALLRQARKALRAVPKPWLYARVDGCIVDGAFWLLEIELLEPSLFLSHSVTAPRDFADAVLAVAVKAS